MAYGGAEILYCDNHLLVAVKPPNVPAQADASGSPDMLTLMKAYVKETFQKPGAAYLGLVHRLDRPVGGLMAFARTSKAAARLSAQFRERSMGRTYLAVVCGSAREAARLEALLESPGGPPRPAALTYRCLERRENLSLLSVDLETGRKHQIRLQLSGAGLPIWGDARYGQGIPGRQIALWAARLTVLHPTTRERLVFCAPPPDVEPWPLFNKINLNIK